MLIIHYDDTVKTMRNKVVTLNRFILSLRASLRSNPIWKTSRARDTNQEFPLLVHDTNKVLLKMMDPREDGNIEIRTFNTFDFMEYKKLISECRTEYGSDSKMCSLNASPITKLNDSIYKLIDIMNTNIASIITFNMPNVLLAIENELMYDVNIFLTY